MIRTYALVALIVLLGGCGKSKSSAPASPPEQAELIFPAENSACTTANEISSTESIIQLTWSSAANATSYEIVIKNLSTQTSSTYSTTLTDLEVTLLRDTPYSWYVISKSTKTTVTAQSDTWKFYMPGPGVVTYAPYPAEVVSPVAGQTISAVNNKITLQWSGADADNDITAYDIYLGTTESPSVFRSNVNGSTLSNVEVNIGSTYYWKIITKDAQGNTSDSGIYQFTVN